MGALFQLLKQVHAPKIKRRNQSELYKELLYQARIVLRKRFKTAPELIPKKRGKVLSRLRPKELKQIQELLYRDRL